MSLFQFGFARAPRSPESSNSVQNLLNYNIPSPSECGLGEKEHSTVTASVSQLADPDSSEPRPKRKLHSLLWWRKSIQQQLDTLKEIDVDLRLSTLKPLHAQWLVNSYNFFDRATRQDNHQGVEKRRNIGYYIASWRSIWGNIQFINSLGTSRTISCNSYTSVDLNFLFKNVIIIIHFI